MTRFQRDLLEYAACVRGDSSRTSILRSEARDFVYYGVYLPGLEPWHTDTFASVAESLAYDGTEVRR